MTGPDLWVLRLDETPTPEPLLATPFLDRWGQFSPDGRWIAYMSDESGRSEVYVMRYPAGSGKWQVSTAGGTYPRWSRDGRELFFQSLDSRLMAAMLTLLDTGVDVQTIRPLFEARAPEGLSRYFYDVVDRDRFLLSVPDAASSGTPLTLVINWTKELAQ